MYERKIRTQLLGALVLVEVIAVSVFAQSDSTCDVTLTRSQDGSLTKIQLKESYALIQYNQDNSWKAYSMSNGQLTVTDSKDTTPSYGSDFGPSNINNNLDSPMEQNLRVKDELDGELISTTPSPTSTTPFPSSTTPFPSSTTEANSADRTELEQLLSSPLTGANFSTVYGNSLLIQSSNNNKWALKSFNGRHVLYADPRGNTMAALNMDDNSSYRHIFQQNGTLSAFVDKKCQVKVVASNKLSYQEATEVANLKRQASADNNHGRRPNFMPPPPPPSFSPFSQFQQQQQQQGHHFYQPPAPQFFRIHSYPRMPF